MSRMAGLIALPFFFFLSFLRRVLYVRGSVTKRPSRHCAERTATVGVRFGRSKPPKHSDMYIA